MKNCKKCGYENNDDYIYCLNCGTPLNDETNLIEDTKRQTSKIAKLPKKYIIIGAAVLAIAGIIGFIFTRLSSNISSKTFGLQTNPICIYSHNGILYGMNDGEITDKKEIDLGHSSSSLDNSIIAFFDDNDDSLYFYNGKTINKIDEDVDNFSINQDGSKIAYSLNNGLYVFDTKNSKTEQAFEGYVNSFVISPNGKYLAFLSEGDMYVYDYNNTKPIDITEAFVMIAINDEQEIFYTDINDSLYVINQDGTVTQIDPYVASINFNRNKTECMVFSNDAGRVYKDGKVISIDGLYDNVIDEIVCPTATSVVTSLNFYYDVYQYDIDSFASKYYLTYEGSLIEVGSDYHIIKFVSDNVDKCCISLDGKTVYFLEDDSLYIYDGISTETIVGDVNKLYDCDLDGKGVYYVTNDRNVSYVDSEKNVKSLGEYKIYSYAVNKDNYFIFFDITSNKAYASKSGNEPITLVEKEAIPLYLCISYDISYFVYDDALLYIKDNCIVEEKSFEEN